MRGHPRPVRVAEVVEGVNAVRRAAGLGPIPDLLPGHPGDGWTCPVARSIALGLPGVRPVWAGTSQIAVYWHGVVVLNSFRYPEREVTHDSPTIPWDDEVRRFIIAFDDFEGRRAHELDRYLAEGANPRARSSIWQG